MTYPIGASVTAGALLEGRLRCDADADAMRCDAMRCTWAALPLPRDAMRYRGDGPIRMNINKYAGWAGRIGLDWK